MEKNNVKIEKFLESVIYGRLSEVKLATDINTKVKAFSTEDSSVYAYLTVLEFCQANYYQFTGILKFL